MGRQGTLHSSLAATIGGGRRGDFCDPRLGAPILKIFSVSVSDQSPIRVGGKEGGPMKPQNVRRKQF